MYNAIRNVCRALVPSNRTNTDACNETFAWIPKKEIDQRKLSHPTPDDSNYRRQRIESSSTYRSITRVPTHICANCGEDFCDKIEWKEHKIHCADAKQRVERVSCPQKGCSFLCSNEDDLKAHTQHAHEESIRVVPIESDTNNSEFKTSRDVVADHTLPFHCKKLEENPKTRREDLSTDGELKEGHTPNDSSIPRRTTECGLTPDEKEHSEKPTSRPSSTEAICSSQHAIVQQAKFGQIEDYSDFLHSLVEDDSMHNELLEPIVTDFLKEMLDKAMSSFDKSFSRTPEICIEDESDLDSDGFEDCEEGIERPPASRALSVASSICFRSNSLNTDGKRIQTTSSNTSSDSSTKSSPSGSENSSRTSSFSGEKKGKGPSRASCEDPKKRRRRFSSFNSENHQEDGRESDEDENGRIERRKLPDSCTNGKNLACPFYQRRPQLHPRPTACVHPGFKTIARLKEHLYRQHYRISCPRCGQHFEEDELKIHLKAKVACESTDEEPSEEYMTTQQKDQLRSKKRKAGQDTPEKKWESIYQLLFPDDMPPLPSPYCELTIPRSTSSSSPHLADFQDFCFQQLRYLLMEKFQSDLRTLEPVVQARLKDSMDEILREAPAQIHRQWEEQRHALASSSSQGSSQAGLDAGKSASNKEAAIDAAITQAQPTEPGQIEQPDLGAPTVEGGAQGTISIPGLREHPKDLSKSHNDTLDIWGSEGFNKPLVDHASTAAMSADLDLEQQAQVFPQISEDPFVPLDAALLMDWNDSFFEPLNFGTDTDTAVMDTSASQLPGRRSDSPLEPLLQKDPDEESYSQTNSCFHFEGPGTMGNVEIDALNSEKWGLDGSTAQHIAYHHDLGPTSLGRAEGHQTSEKGKTEQSGISMTGLPEEHDESSFMPPLFRHPNWDGSGSSDS